MILGDKIDQRFEQAGFWVVRKHAPANMDMLIIIVSDRSKLKDKQTFYLSIAISGLEMMQGYEIIEDRLEHAIREYSKVMENYGGFERADICVSTGSPQRERKGVYRQDSGLYVPDERLENDRWQSPR